MRADVAIITTRADEFEAVLKRFGPNKPQKCSSGRTYGICQVSTRNEKNCIVALVCCSEAGSDASQQVTYDIIRDLDPYMALLRKWQGCDKLDVILNNEGTDFMDTSTPFKWRHFQAEIILLCVRWYLRYPLSYRDLEEMMAERGLHVDHTTTTVGCNTMHQNWRSAADPHLKATNDSWRVDETYVKVKKAWMYLYRAPLGHKTWEY